MKNFIFATLAVSAALSFTGCMGGSGKSVHVENLPSVAAPGMVSPRAAVDAALSHAGLELSSVTLTKCEKDREWGALVYEIEFERGFFEYEYEVDARTGKVLTSEKSWDW